MTAIPGQNVHLLRFPIQPKKASLELPVGGVVEAAFRGMHQVASPNLSALGGGIYANKWVANTKLS